MSKPKISLWRDAHKRVKDAELEAKKSKPSPFTDRIFRATVTDEGQLVLESKIRRPLGDLKIPRDFPGDPDLDAYKEHALLILGNAELENFKALMGWVDDTFFGVRSGLEEELAKKVKEVAQINKDLKSDQPVLMEVMRTLMDFALPGEGARTTLARILALAAEAQKARDDAPKEQEVAAG